jgi:hypothetical protein
MFHLAAESYHISYQASGSVFDGELPLTFDILYSVFLTVITNAKNSTLLRPSLARYDSFHQPIFFRRGCRLGIRVPFDSQ